MHSFEARLLECPACSCPNFLPPSGSVPATVECVNRGFQRIESGFRPDPKDSKRIPCRTRYSTDNVRNITITRGE